ncbi:Lecithin:cholesterol/phospholipid:diacylglycerol acyltransferase [Dichotomocladium elegans]|nr:Lecithin:cholesterol/phospholipid:diacylglycerol acyltransferase [Dichotomocladium elegans]
MQRIILSRGKVDDMACTHCRSVTLSSSYWVWARIIENLAAIGYDTNNMYLASYDWRLSFSNLEVRDGYFTRLRSSIETFRRIHNRKVVVVAHSMGSNLFPYFLKWVESPVGGNAGSSWTEDHIETFANIAGPMVGVPKAMTAFLSGETRDTMALGSFGAYLLEKFFSRRERASLMRSWAGGASMLPKGGELFWGSVEQAPDDPTDSYMLGNHPSYGSMLSFIGNKIREKNSTIENKTDAAQSVSGPAKQTMSSRHLTVAGAMSLLHENTSEDFQTMLRTNYSYGITTSKSQLEKNDNDFTKWSNSLESKLPDAPSMKIFCMYGSGLPTERSYYYAEASNEQSETCSKEDEDCEDADDDVGQDPLQQAENIGLSVTSTANDILNPPELYIDATAHDPDNNVRTGIRFSDGDGTVPLLSLGYMCAPSGGWRKHADLYNPSHIPVVVREYKNEVSESSFDVRGGKKAGDHVDILGNWEMVTDILRLVSNQAENVTERILSDIERYAANIRLIPEP